MTMMEKEFSVRKFSDVSGSSVEAELKMLLESIDIPLRGLTVVRPVHSTVLSRSHCFQITTPSETRYFTCNSAEDANNWVAGLKEIIYPNRNKQRRVDTSLDVWVFEAKGLPSKKKYYCEIVLDKVLYGRTSTKLKSDILFWGEQFSFDDLPSIRSLSLYVFKENESKKKRKERSIYVGALEVPLHSIKANSEIETWLNLRPPGTSPKPSPKNSVNKSDQLSVRVKVKYQTVSILPITKYKDLHEFVKQNYIVLCKELESTISLKAKDELAQTMLKILHVTNQAKEFLADIIIAEVNTLENENLTFRGNTLATKSMDTYMKMVGQKYLHSTLAQFITSLYDMEEDIEVDPTKLTSGNLADNQKNLLRLVEEAWSNILTSRHLFPRDLQDTFGLIKRRCQALEKDVSVKLISGSVFLRFLCPAILSPSLFGLTREYPNEKTARCLTLIAKTLQNLANFTRFGGKEAYMEGLNEFVERELPNMKQFLNMISSDCDACENNGFDGYIDLGRELSFLKNLINEQLVKLSEETKQNLNPLCEILASLQMSEDFSYDDQSSSDFVENRPSRATSSSSINVAKESDKTSVKLSYSELATNTCFKDATLSSAQDYVSGCSLIMHTPSKSKSFTSERTKGRSNESDVNSSKFSKSLNLASLESLRSGDGRDQSQFLRSSSFHGRSSRDEKASMFKPAKSFDTDKLLGHNISKSGGRHRQWFSSTKSDSRLRSKSDQMARASDDTPVKMKSSSSLHNEMNFAATTTMDKSKFSLNDDRDKTIRRIPDIIHQSAMWSDSEQTEQQQQPLYFSPATEPMTPLGKRQFKFGLESLHQLQSSYNSNPSKTHIKPSRSEFEGDTVDRRPLGVNSQSFSNKANDNDFSASFNHSSNLREASNSKSMSAKSLNSDYENADENASPPVSKTMSVDRLESKSITKIKQNNEDELDDYRPLKLKPTLELIMGAGGDQKPLSDSAGFSTNDINEEFGFDQTKFNNNNYRDSTRHSRKYEKMMEGRHESGFQDENRHFEQQDCSVEHYQEEVKELRHLLRDTRLQLELKESEFAKRAKIYEQTIASGKKKLEETERKLQAQKKDKEEQMKSIISRLTNVESELHDEQSEMQEIVQAKQKIIEVQEKRIRSLDSANKRLVAAVNQLRAKHNSNNS